MNLLFVHDHKFRRNNGIFYSTGALDHMALARYVRVFDKVKILARIIDESDCSKYSRIHHDNIEIIDIRTLSLKQIKEEMQNTDRIIVRLPSFYGMLALHLNNRIKKPYLIEMVGCPWDEFWNYSWKAKFIAPIITLLDKMFLKRANYVIYVTNEFLQRRYPTKGKSISCSNVTLFKVDEIVYHKRCEKIGSYSADEKLIIGTTAAIDVKYKGQQYVIRALSNLKKQGIENFEYQVVGNGNPDYLSSIIRKEGMEDQVKILGGMPHEKVFDWLDTIDIYIQPSKQEGLPRALIEAMSRGLPSIGSATAGIPELLDKSYIYNHSAKEHISIAGKLCEIRKDMAGQARRNFDEAKKYENEILEQRRYDFLCEFRDMN